MARGGDSEICRAAAVQSAWWAAVMRLNPGASKLPRAAETMKPCRIPAASAIATMRTSGSVRFRQSGVEISAALSGAPGFLEPVASATPTTYSDYRGMRVPHQYVEWSGLQPSTGSRRGT